MEAGILWGRGVVGSGDGLSAANGAVWDQFLDRGPGRP